MRLATLKKGGRDGTLVVVNRDLTRAVRATHIAPTMQKALDDWADVETPLRAIAHLLEHGQCHDAFDFASTSVMAPLPRAYQWLDGSAYLYHVELVRKARKAEMPPSFYSDPLMYQGGSDSFIGPTDDILVRDESWGIDLEGEVAVVIGDVPMGASPAQAADAIRLVMLVNDVSLRNLIPTELAKGFGFVQAKPATAFGPVAVTPDGLGSAWDGGKLNLPLISHVNGKCLGQPNTGIDINFDFPTLIAHAARTRELEAGTIIGSGTISNRDPAAGSACLAERRMIETIETGAPSTPFLCFGDRVRLEILDADSRSVFGAIDQRVVHAV